MTQSQRGPAPELFLLLADLIIYNLSQSKDWRKLRWDQFWSLLTHARPHFLLAALAATFSSYLLRAYRWRWFLVPIKKASLWVLFVGQIFGFRSIYLISRPAEFVRPAYIARKEGVPIAVILAVWLLERIYDTVFPVLLFAAALYLSPLDPAAASACTILHWLHAGVEGRLPGAIKVGDYGRCPTPPMRVNPFP